MAKKKQEKQLSISMLKEYNKRFDEIVDIPVDFNGEEYVVKMHPFFSPTKVKELVDNLITFYKNAEKEKLPVPQELEDDLVGYFIVGTFSNLKLSLTKKAKSIFEDFKVAIDSPLFKILMQSYPQESVKEVFDRIYEVIEMSAKLESQFKAYQEKIKELPLENRDIIFGKQKQIPEV